MSSLTFNTTLSKFYSSYFQASYSYLQDNNHVTTHEKEAEETKAIEKSHLKERVLTYYRNELLITPISNIAYIYLEHSITYVVDLDGKRKPTNYFKYIGYTKNYKNGKRSIKSRNFSKF